MVASVYVTIVAVSFVSFESGFRIYQSAAVTKNDQLTKFVTKLQKMHE